MTSATEPADTIRARPELIAVKQLLASADLPTADLQPEHLQHFFACGSEDSPRAVVGLQIFGGAALLRSLAVAPASRSAGLGSSLVRHAEAHARFNGVQSLFLLTTTAEAFFARLGYVRAERSAAPAAIAATAEFASLCPASSAFMMKRL
jgi:amino-acid N-acetyltransferase